MTGDCFVATILCCLVLQCIRPVLQNRCNIDIGAYENPNDKVRLLDDDEPRSVSFCQWFQQTIVWIIIILLVRVVILLGVYCLRNILYETVAVIVTPLESNIQLVLALVIVPLIGNNIQFWMQDTFLKSKRETMEEIPVFRLAKTTPRSGLSRAGSEDFIGLHRENSSRYTAVMLDDAPHIDPHSGRLRPVAEERSP